MAAKGLPRPARKAATRTSRERHRGSGRRSPRGRVRPPSAAAVARASEVFERLAKAWPEAGCALHHANAYQLLVATILSAQCTDARVNLVTPEFFRRWPDATALARAGQDEVEAVVRSTGFFRHKARNLRGMAARVVARHGGGVPRSLEDLVELPGVARKTANVVRGVMWRLADGVVVDTHVHRLAGRLGWSRGRSPEQVERDLMALHPRERWVDLAHLLIHHGRAVCRARRPECARCPIGDLCPSARVSTATRPRKR